MEVLTFWIGCLGEIAQLKLKQKLWDEKRREALNKIIDIKGKEGDIPHLPKLLILMWKWFGIFVYNVVSEMDVQAVFESFVELDHS